MTTLLAILGIIQDIGFLLAVNTLVLLAITIGAIYAVVTVILETRKERRIDNLVREELAAMQRLLDSDRK